MQGTVFERLFFADILIDHPKYEKAKASEVNATENKRKYYVSHECICIIFFS